MDIPKLKRRLLWHGLALFMLGLLVGIIIPMLLNPRAGVTAHLEGVQNGMFLMILGLTSAEFALGQRGRLALFWTGVYGTYSNYFASLLTAIWGTRNMTPIVGKEMNHAPDWQEAVVTFGFGTCAIAIIACVGIALYGMRGRIAPVGNGDA